jgi:hypothetical protein
MVPGGDVQVTAHIDAPALVVYSMISDVTRMGLWSPETTGCRWLNGASGPAVGNRFKGSNKAGWRRWSTTCTVTAAERGRRFAFDVSLSRYPIARWGYEIEADGVGIDGCTVTESWADRRPRWMHRLSPYVMGERDWAERNRVGMETTLAALKRAAESPRR